MLVACESCDQLHEAVELSRGFRAACNRCGERLYGSPVDSLERTLALSISALVLLVVANVFPFLSFSLKGQSQENHIFTGVADLFGSGFEPLVALREA